MIRILLFTILGICAYMDGMPQSQAVFAKHDPNVDYNLSPAHNQKINPTYNASINPKFNWNINPIENKAINPDASPDINPIQNSNLNPKDIELYNPMFNNILHPKNSSWNGRYLFDSTDHLIGFISMASQNILLCFNKEGEWTCYFIKTSKGTYNQFHLTGEWTGRFLCQDSSEGYNLFNKEGIWTGSHVK